MRVPRIPTSPQNAEVEHEELDNTTSARGRKNLLKRLAPVLLGLALGLSVCAPFFRGGWLLLLDWVVGPHTPILGPSFYGLNGGINGDFLFGIVTTTLVHLLGSSMTWIPIFLFFPLATYSISRLTSKNLVAQLAAGLFFAINPFVIDRIYAGQLAVIYGYLMLPILFKWSYEWITEERPRAGRVALLLTLMISVDVHYAWIGGLVVAVAAAIGFKRSAQFRLSFLRLLLLLIPLNIYLVVPVLGHKLAVNPVDNNALLKAFETRPDQHLGLFLNVLGLHGFWRPMPESSKNLISGWPLFLAAILLIAGYGIWQLRKKNKSFTAFITIAFILGFFLSLGAQGPTGSLFHWAYGIVPAFSMMREPEKFSSILATVLSLAFGEGIFSLCASQPSKKLATTITSTGFLLALAYNPVAFWGIHGQIGTSKLPSSWNAAAKIIGKGSGYTLVLPWDLYLSFPFTNHRIIANPGPAFLPGNVISGDNIELGNVFTTSASKRSAHIAQLIRNISRTNDIGFLLAPIGVEYLVIYRTYATGSLTWISAQKDLKTVFWSTQTIVLKNQDFHGLALKLPLNKGGSTELNSQTLRDRTSPTTDLSMTSVLVKDSTNYHFTEKTPGIIDLAIPYEAGWRINGETATESTFGTLLFNSPVNRNVTAIFQPWKYIELGYIFSALTYFATGLHFINSCIAFERPRNASGRDRCADGTQ